MSDGDSRHDDLPMQTVWVYAHDDARASVCSRLPYDLTVETLNAQLPTGIGTPWMKEDGPFGDGAPNPCRCNTEPRTHRHWLFYCLAYS